MGRLVCKLITVFISIGLAVSAQANLIIDASPEYKAFAKGNVGTVNNVNGWKYSNQDSSPDTSPFSGNLLSIFQNVTLVAKPAYDVVFSYGAREFDGEKFNFKLDASIATGNFFDRVRANTPVSESGSIVLFAVGLFSLAMTRRKMKMKA